MMASEIIFVSGLPVGRLLMGSCSQEIYFHFEPASVPSKVQSRKWQCVDQLRNAVIAAYKNTCNNQVSKGGAHE